MDCIQKQHASFQSYYQVHYCLFVFRYILIASRLVHKLNTRKKVDSVRAVLEKQQKWVPGIFPRVVKAAGA